MEAKEKSMYIKAAVAGLLVSSCFMGGYALSQRSLPPPMAEAAPAVLARSADTRTLAPPNFAEIADQQGPAVVNIRVTGMVRTRTAPGTPQLDPRDPFYEFFRRFQPPGGVGEAPAQGTGSGFIVKSDGVVLTNAHVVADASEVTVKLKDKREFKAKVVGLDKLSDVAVLKIDAKDLPTVKIGDPKTARVGEWVVAIGSPFGFENTVTAGIVSAKSRTLPDEGYVYAPSGSPTPRGGCSTPQTQNCWGKPCLEPRHSKLTYKHLGLASQLPTPRTTVPRTAG